MNEVTQPPATAPAPTHSPEPWTVSKECREIILGREGQIVAVVSGPDAIGNRDRIIQAANFHDPMIEALKLARHTIQVLDDDHRFGCSLNAMDTIDSVLRDIALAREESHLNEAMDDINGGGPSNRAQFSKDS